MKVKPGWWGRTSGEQTEVNILSENDYSAWAVNRRYERLIPHSGGISLLATNLCNLLRVSLTYIFGGFAFFSLAAGGKEI